ncbi:uncharacterized protein BDCG_02944 [Blastomyces dermatitidis ER-3]|uniref:CCZ1/INTU/HSP4 first Longin domain-containing protein n=3 Tax=Blastomyces TaxID=229219 RepID=A0A179UED8_BLAGS|nr:uncharacterized protein BDBG_02598 [Blastomyces gilchristii SLH14081]XP_045275077.1 uncharacterized protein BDCG_02944 [Blastomyces dermatitidis ER-3]EEQ87824.2 hypothetical protein BDCG_02944 [Blastomyces dermatitidis ER-3]EGE79226.2 hypothetical protein BDDG_02164 [Blastomyces dermatitidis ATCC 18188]OAT06385.1 hypothetical protein BDBG_02598 [Blastomyces gilchristii SLH14081]
MRRSMPPKQPSSVVPAQLSFLAIYNPSLGSTDETLRDQIVFYYSRKENEKLARSTQQRAAQRGATDCAKIDNNEKLRQIGLAQGMVSFAKNFSNGEAVDTVETEKSRIVLHELETGWWILASIDYTRISSEPLTSPESRPDNAPEPLVEYSSREVAPARLILQQLLRAHSIFLLHHGPSLGVLYSRLQRTAFCSALEYFWLRFVWNWNPLLNGNPAVEIYNGIKLAATGELGIGVGEEEWGSGEREVLEDFVSRTDGLVDLVVSRFGDTSPNGQRDNSPGQQSTNAGSAAESHPWIGCNTPPHSFDGVVFSGVGAISKQSLTRVSHWMEWIYRYGEDTFGVRRDPKSIHRRKRRKGPEGGTSNGESKAPNPKSPSRTPKRSLSPGIPPPILAGPNSTIKQATEMSKSRESNLNAQDSTKSSTENSADPSGFGTEKFMKLLTLGYGTSWADPSNFSLSHPRVNFLRFGGSPQPAAGEADSLSVASSTEPESTPLPRTDNNGRFIIGLRDDPEIEDSDEEDDPQATELRNPQAKGSQKERTVLRTLTLMMEESASNGDFEDTASIDKYQDLQVVVYLNQPFMFTFLFESKTSSLSSPSFYRSIHHQIGPLQKPLLLSTSLDKIPQRAPLWDQYRNSKEKPSGQSPLYDFIYDPEARFIHTSLPDIPEPGMPVQTIKLSSPGSSEPPWTRQDTINVHTQIINTYIETRNRASEIERTCRTSRGWWVLWMRLKDTSVGSHSSKQVEGEEGEGEADEGEQQSRTPSTLQQTPAPKAPKEAFLVRKASDCAVSGHTRHSSGARFFRDISGASAASQSSTGNGRGSWLGPGKLAEGVGLDARRYIQALLNLNR